MATSPSLKHCLSMVLRHTLTPSVVMVHIRRGLGPHSMDVALQWQCDCVLSLQAWLMDQSQAFFQLSLFQNTATVPVTRWSHTHLVSTENGGCVSQHLASSRTGSPSLLGGVCLNTVMRPSEVLAARRPYLTWGGQGSADRQTMCRGITLLPAQLILTQDAETGEQQALSPLHLPIVSCQPNYTCDVPSALCCINLNCQEGRVTQHQHGFEQQCQCTKSDTLTVSQAASLFASVYPY
jgi:hypothetical protein